jgi:hypothetical protein
MSFKRWRMNFTSSFDTSEKEHETRESYGVSVYWSQFREKKTTYSSFSSHLGCSLVEILRVLLIFSVYAVNTQFECEVLTGVIRRILSTRKWRRVVRYKFIDISEECTASTSAAVEQEDLLLAGCLLDLLIHPKDAGCGFFHNMNVYRTIRRHIPQASTHTKELSVSQNLRRRKILQWIMNWKGYRMR